MTKEERIDWLCRLRSNIQCYMDVATLSDDVRKSFVQVLTEVIEQEPCKECQKKIAECNRATSRLSYEYGRRDALEQEPCETSTDEPMTMVYPTIFCDDAISLADAKEIIARNDSTNGKIAVFTGKQVQQMLDSLPRILTKPIECDDAISREAVIKLFNGQIGSESALILHKIKKLPSVQPSRKGHWELLANELYMCSECNAKWTMKLNFCPNCGACMKEGDTE